MSAGRHFVLVTAWSVVFALTTSLWERMNLPLPDVVLRTRNPSDWARGMRDGRVAGLRPDQVFLAWPPRGLREGNRDVGVQVLGPKDDVPVPASARGTRRSSSPRHTADRRAFWRGFHATCSDADRTRIGAALRELVPGPHAFDSRGTARETGWLELTAAPTARRAGRHSESLPYGALRIVTYATRQFVTVLREGHDQRVYAGSTRRVWHDPDTQRLALVEPGTGNVRVVFLPSLTIVRDDP